MVGSYFVSCFFFFLLEIRHLLLRYVHRKEPSRVSNLFEQQTFRWFFFANQSLVAVVHRFFYAFVVCITPSLLFFSYTYDENKDGQLV